MGIERRARTVLTGAAVVAFAAPLVLLPLRALADVWRAPSLVPQEIGGRGFSIAFSETVGAGEALVNSLVVACATTALALVLGWPAARVLGERALRWRSAVFLVLALPLLVPPYALGTGLVEWFLRLRLTDSLPALVLAHLVVVLPYVTLLLAAGFGARLTDLEEMGRALGAGPVRRLALVTLPSMRSTLAAALLIGFLVSWSQYGTSLAVGGGLPMLPIVMLPFAHTDPQVAAALSLLFLAPALAALAVAARATRGAL